MIPSVGTALIYIRQSKKREESVSPEVQEDACRQLPAVAACSTVIVLKDLGLSGGKPPEKRPGFLAMRDRIFAADRKREPLVVAAYNQSRISRDNIDAFNFYKLLEDRPWVDLVMHDGKFERSPSGELTWGVMALTATHLRKSTGKNIKATYAKKNQQGQPTGPAPYGYRYATREPGAALRLEIDPETAPTVLRVFEMYANGDHSASTIANTLAAEGIHAPATRKGRWVGDNVQNMLQNVAYVAKTYSESRPKRTGDLIAATWPPIISEALFNRVQERRNAKRLTVTNGGDHARAFTFRGLLWCTHCHRRLTAQFSHEVVYYRCGSYEFPTSERCDLAKKAIRETELLPWVDRIMDGLEQGQMDGKWLLKTGTRVDKETAAEVVAKIERKIKRTGIRFAEEELTREEYRAELARLRRQREAYAAMSADEPDPKELTTLAGKWRTGDAAQRWEVLNALFERIHVRQDRKVEGYTPRMDRANRVRLLIGTAFDIYYGWSEKEAEGPGAATNRLRRGKGGIRTLEGALHPLPA
jgi:DNA invertase Pin-like site-specific DNA recombinase